jgi:multicomponent Na+:H+ antiporter subunit F
MNVALTIALIIVLLSGAVVSSRAIRRGTIGDRAVAMDALTAFITCGLLIASAITGDSAFLDIALVLGLLAFLTSVAVARFIERRGL